MKTDKNERHLARRDFLRLGAAAAGIGLLQPCGPAAPAWAATASTGGEPKRGGTLTLARTTAIQEFNPFSINPGHHPFMRALWNTLGRYDPQLNLKPDLAEKWEFSADGKTLALKLRQGVKFHSGREFTAEDVKASVEFGQTNDRALFMALFKTIKQVEIADKTTVAFRFDSVNPSAFDMLDALWIIDRETVQDRGKTAVGTGPFKLDKYVPNDHLDMSAFKDYWEKGKPYLDRYVVRQVPDPASLAINLESGAVDCIYQPAYVDAARLQSTGGKYVVERGSPGSSIYDVALNVKVEPFTNKKARQAIAWSIDRARFCKTILQGLSEPTCLTWPPHSWAYFKDLEGKIGFDLDKAKALLKEAGLEKGFDVELVSSSSFVAGTRELGELIQSDLKKIGVNAKVADLETSLYQSRTQTKRDLTMMTHSYGRAGRDPGSLLTGAKAWYTGKEGSWTHYESAEYEKLRQDIQSTLDREKRKAIARQIQELVLDECFTIPVAEVPRVFVYGSYLKGFGKDMDNSPFVADFWLDK